MHKYVCIKTVLLFQSHVCTHVCTHSYAHTEVHVFTISHTRKLYIR